MKRAAEGQSARRPRQRTTGNSAGTAYGAVQLSELLDRVVAAAPRSPPLPRSPRQTPPSPPSLADEDAAAAGTWWPPAVEETGSEAEVVGGGKARSGHVPSLFRTVVAFLARHAAALPPLGDLPDDLRLPVARAAALALRGAEGEGGWDWGEATATLRVLVAAGLAPQALDLARSGADARRAAGILDIVPSEGTTAVVLPPRQLPRYLVAAMARLHALCDIRLADVDPAPLVDAIANEWHRPHVDVHLTFTGDFQPPFGVFDGLADAIVRDASLAHRLSLHLDVAARVADAAEVTTELAAAASNVLVALRAPAGFRPPRRRPAHEYPRLRRLTADVSTYRLLSSATLPALEQLDSGTSLLSLSATPPATLTDVRGPLRLLLTCLTTPGAAIGAQLTTLHLSLPRRTADETDRVLDMLGSGVLPRLAVLVLGTTTANSRTVDVDLSRLGGTLGDTLESLRVSALADRAARAAHGKHTVDELSFPASAFVQLRALRHLSLDVEPSGHWAKLTALPNLSLLHIRILLHDKAAVLASARALCRLHANAALRVHLFKLVTAGDEDALLAHARLE